MKIVVKNDSGISGWWLIILLLIVLLNLCNRLEQKHEIPKQDTLIIQDNGM